MFFIICVLLLALKDTFDGKIYWNETPISDIIVLKKIIYLTKNKIIAINLRIFNIDLRDSQPAGLKIKIQKKEM